MVAAAGSRGAQPAADGGGLAAADGSRGRFVEAGGAVAAFFLR